MYPFPSLNDSPFYIRVPFAATFNYGMIKFATKYGTKVAEGVINFKSYLLMHTIGAIFIEVSKKAGNYFEQKFKKIPTENSSTLKNSIYKVITVFDFVVNRIDHLYCFIIKKTFGEIHSFKEASKLPDRKLCMSEIFRKVLAMQIKEQFLYIGSWEIGRRGTELLLKTTVTTLLPCTKAVYTAIFCLSFYRKVHNQRLEVYKEQKEEINLIFIEPERLINEQIRKIFDSLVLEVDSIKVKTDAPNHLELFQHIEELRQLSAEFREIVDAFELEWQYYNSEEIDLLNENAAFYQSICDQYDMCKTPQSLQNFKNDLETYVHPNTTNLFGRISNFISTNE